MRNAQEAGEAFEVALWKLLGRVIPDDLGLDLLENRRQGSSLQWGYDIRARWRAADGHVTQWHFECKSQKANLTPEQVLPKLEQILTSAHRLDVWCLACLAAEPTNVTDEAIRRKRSDRSVPFSLVVLSRQTGFLKNLFACHSDLFAEVYREPAPTIDPVERQRRIDSFGRMLDEETRRGRTKTLAPGWTRLERQSLATPARSSDSAGAFLRGLRPTNPWNSVVHGWAIDRPSATKPLADRIDQMAPGIDAVWLWGAGGEGKSTVLRDIAAKHLSSDSDWDVLWMDGQTLEARAVLPIQWLEQRGPCSRALLILDSVTDVALGSLLTLERQIIERQSRVFLLLASRGVARARRPELRRQLKAMSKGESESQLHPLEADELANLVAHLATLGVLHGFDESTALALLTERRKSYTAGASWLLPTLMQLTDVKGRGFEKILEDVLLGLTDHENRRALELLLAVSVCQASGSPFRVALVAPLLSGQMTPSEAFDVLAGELADNFGVSHDAAALATVDGVGWGGAVLVHHDVIAEGFATVAAERYVSSYFEAVEAVAGCMASSVRPDIVIPRPLFHILESVLKGLRGSRQHEAAERFLQAWVSLDDRQFPAWHRLGTQYSQHLQEQPQGSADHKIRILLDAGVESFQKGIAAARAVLERNDTPEPWIGDTIADQTRKGLSGLATICGRAGVMLKEQNLTRQATALATLSLSNDIKTAGERHHNVVVITNLVYGLIGMEEFRAAAAALEVVRRLDPNPAKIPRVSDVLARNSVEVPEEPFGSLAQALRRITPDLAQALEEGSVYDTEGDLTSMLERAAEAPLGWR
jgi:hypothetical protein